MEGDDIEWGVCIGALSFVGGGSVYWVGSGVGWQGQGGLSSGTLFSWVWSIVLGVNLVGLLPYTFTPTSHLCFTLPLCVSLWVVFTTHVWSTSLGVGLITAVPFGTPLALIPFIVLIESISLIIRPVTLSVRLTANIVAGHCLLGLVSGGLNSLLSFFPSILFQSSLMVLELAVAVIQSYVLVVLVSLYSKGTSTA